MRLSKSKVDRAGLALAKDEYRSDDEYFELEEVFDEYRKSHLQPLTESTLELQHWLSVFDAPYYIAQRLKRKPQIIRKLNRFSVRLTQLQDIGGCRIIVESDRSVDTVLQFISEHIANQKHIRINRSTDYRAKGRDITGYRAVHVILEVDQKKLELQIRSRVQHYWAESIERTSVIYGYHLKENEGDQAVIFYFKELSDIFYEIEAGREPSPASKIELDRLRKECEGIIEGSERNRIFDSHVNEDIIKQLTAIEAGKRSSFNNWIIIFDWNTGCFVSWDIVDRDPDAAISSYVRNEELFPVAQGFEVVMIGSSDVATVRQTHSHYFGIEKYDSILESLDQAVIGFSRREDIDTGARQILLKLYQREAWGKRKSIARSTLRNHFCKNVFTFDYSLGVLIEKGLVLANSARGGAVFLNLAKKGEIEAHL